MGHRLFFLDSRIHLLFIGVITTPVIAFQRTVTVQILSIIAHFTLLVFFYIMCVCVCVCVYIYIPFFFHFRATSTACGSSQAGTESELQLTAYATATASWIQAISLTCAAACSNTGYLTHWGRPGIELTSLWTQCCVLKPLSHSRNFSYFLLWKSICIVKNLILVVKLGGFYLCILRGFPSKMELEDMK